MKMELEKKIVSFLLNVGAGFCLVAFGVATIPAVILVSSGVADFYGGISPVISLPSTATIIAAALIVFSIWPRIRGLKPVIGMLSSEYNRWSKFMSWLAKHTKSWNGVQLVKDWISNYERGPAREHLRRSVVDRTLSPTRRVTILRRTKMTVSTFADGSSSESSDRK